MRSVPRPTPDMTRRILTPLAVAALLFGSWSSATKANGAVPAIAALALGPETTALRIDGELNDDASPSDWVSIHRDSFCDRRSAYEFGVNASGVKYDRCWFNDTSEDRGWDAVWDVAVTRHAGG